MLYRGQTSQETVDRTVLIRLPLGVARYLNGRAINVDEIIREAINDGTMRRTKMVPYHFRYSPMPAMLSSEVCEKISKHIFDSDEGLLGRYAGVLISSVFKIPVIPISGSLADKDTVKS